MNESERRISAEIGRAYKSGDDAELGAAFRKLIDLTLRARGIEPPARRQYLAVSRPPTDEILRR